MQLASQIKKEGSPCQLLFWSRVDFEHMSEVAAEIVKKNIVQVVRKKRECVLGLATGNSPTGVYKHLAKAANEGAFDSGRIRSFKDGA